MNSYISLAGHGPWKIRTFIWRRMIDLADKTKIHLALKKYNCKIFGCKIVIHFDFCFVKNMGLDAVVSEKGGFDGPSADMSRLQG